MSITETYNNLLNTYSDIHEHLPTLKRYASECEHVTEMGFRSVVSTWAFLEGKPKRLVCIDIAPCPIEEAERLAKEAGIEFKFMQADTANPELTIEPTDLLFIDTYHIYEQLKQELKLHPKHVRKYIILHDTTTLADIGERTDYNGTVLIVPENTDNPRGIWRAVEEFLHENKFWALKERYTNNNGLTVLERISDDS